MYFFKIKFQLNYFNLFLNLIIVDTFNSANLLSNFINHYFFFHNYSKFVHNIIFGHYIDFSFMN